MSRCTLACLLTPAPCAPTLCSPLQIVSRLNYGANPAMREPFYRRFYLPLQVALEAAAELHAEAFTPQARPHGQAWIAWVAELPACICPRAPAGLQSAGKQPLLVLGC